METAYTIKHVPEDFVVREQLDIAMADDGQYTYLELAKRDYSMLQVVDLLAKHFGVPQKLIGYAGTKDKKAITTQLISLKLPHHAVSARLLSFNYKDLSLRPVGRGKNPISLGDHAGNRFTIVVHGISTPPQPREWYVNYFDEQRFQKNNVEIGRCILKRRFEDACVLIDDTQLQAHLQQKPNDCVGALRRLPTKLLLMYLHSYQSYLWNKAVSLCIEKEIPRVARIQYSLGYLAIPRDDAGLVKVQSSLPIIGFGTDEGCESVAGLMKEEGIKPRDFILRELPELSSEGGERDMLVHASHWAVSALEEDTLREFRGKKKCTVSFFLPKAAYATMVLRQAFLL